MTRRPKSARKSKASRAVLAKAARAKGRRAHRELRARNPLDDLVDAAARALDLKLEPAWKAAVKTNLEITLRLAGLFADFPLPDDAEPAPIFSA